MWQELDMGSSLCCGYKTRTRQTRGRGYIGYCSGSLSQPKTPMAHAKHPAELGCGMKK